MNGPEADGEATGFPLLYEHVGGDLRPAPAGDQAIARSYPGWPEKGEIVRGRRLTILTARRRVRPGDEVRILHVAEALDADARLYTMGPKAVFGEYVDGQPATAPEEDEDGDPLWPGNYDGPVVPGPAVDYGYAVTVYRFEAAGPHRIVWRLGDLLSNELLIQVEP